MKLSKEKIAIYLLLLLTFAKGLFWSNVIPIFQTPDEQCHYANVQHYAEPKNYQPQSHNFPIKETDLYNYKTQNLSPELMAVLEKTFFEKVRFNYQLTAVFKEGSLNGSGEEGIRKEKLSRFILKYPPWGTNYSPQYYSSAAFLENTFSDLSIFERVYIIRFFSVLIMVLLIFIGYLCFKELSLSSKESLLLAAALSFQPMLTFITSSINIDSMLFLGFFIFILGGLKFIKRFSFATLLFMIVGIWLGCQAKPSGYFMIPVFLVLLLYALTTNVNLKVFSRKTLALKNGLSKKLILKYAGVGTAILIGIFALIKFLKMSLGYFKNLEAFKNLPNQLLKQAEYENTLRRSFSYWGDFGWLDTYLKFSYIVGIWILLGISTMGFIFYLKNQYQEQKKGIPSTRKHLHQLIFLLIMLVGVNFMIYFMNLYYPVLDYQGRYFFPSIIAKFALIGFGLSYFFKKFISREQTLLVLFIIMLFLNMISLFGFLIPRYYL